MGAGSPGSMIGWPYSAGFIAAAQFALVISVGAIVSYTDLRFGKIRNSHVFFLASAGAALTLCQSYSQGMLMWWVSSAFMSVCVPALLWRRGLIPAGDSKLLMAMGLAVPSWWYPSFAPLVFQFSVVFFLAFLLLAVPVVWTALFKRGSVHPVEGAQTVIDRFGRDAYSTPLSKAIRRWTGDGGLVSEILLPAWIFIVGWVGWVETGRFGLDIGYFLALGVAITFISFFLQEFCVRLKMPVFLSVPSLLIVGAAGLWFGVSAWILVLTASGAAVLVFSTGFLRERVSASTIDMKRAQDVSPGSVIDGVGPEGISEDSAARISGEGVPVGVFQEVRFAHALFLALLIIGLVKVIEYDGQVVGWISEMVGRWL